MATQWHSSQRESRGESFTVKRSGPEVLTEGWAIMVSPGRIKKEKELEVPFKELFTLDVVKPAKSIVS